MTGDPQDTSPALPPVSHSGRRLHWPRWLAAVGAIAVLWTVVPGMWLPGWIKPRVEAAASEALGTPLSIGEIRISPWTGVLSLAGVRVGPAASPLLTVAHAEAHLSLESVWRLAPVLRRVDIVQPEAWVERLSAQRFNFSSVVDKLMARPAQGDASSEPARFAVFNIALRDGTLHYTDHVLHQSHRIEQLRIGVPFISNLPSFIDVDVEPLLSASIDGSPLSIKGQTLPFTQGLRSAVKLHWVGVDVPHWLAAAQALLPPAWHMRAETGRLDADVALKFEARKPPQVPLLAVEGGFKLSQLAIKLPRAPVMGEVDAGWQVLSVEGLDVQPLEQRFKVGAVALEGLRWRNRQQGPTRGAVAGPAQEATPQPAAPWAWQIGKLEVVTATLDIQTQPDQPWPALDTLQLHAQGLGSAATSAPATWQLEARDAHGGKLLAQGHAHVARQQLDAQLNLDKAALAPWLAPLRGTLKLPLQIDEGEASVQASIQARLLTASALEPAEARVLSGHVALDHLVLKPVRKGLDDQLKLAALSLDGIQAHVDLGGSPGSAPALRSLSMDALAIQKLDAAVTRGPRGEWLGVPPAMPASRDAAPLVAPSRAAMPPARSGADAADHAAVPRATAEPRITLASLHCADCQWRFKDQAVTPAARFEAHEVTLHATDLGNDLRRPLSLELSTLAQGQGRLMLKGTLTPQPFALDAAVKVGALDLRAVQPYIDPLVNITVAGAKAQAEGRLNLRMPDKGPLQTRYKGSLGLSEVRVLDRVNDADFLSWRSLTLDGADLALAGDALDANLGRIGLRDFYGRIIVNPSGKLNVAGIPRSQAGAEARSITTPESSASSALGAVPTGPASSPSGASSTTPGATASTGALPGTARKPTPKLRWDRIQLAKGRVDFTDNYIKPNYSARLTRIEGEVSAVSSTKPEPATVKISGAVDDAAPLVVSGRLHPLGPQLYTDIEGSAKGIELTRLTPYAARYAGYAIDKGTLSVTVRYKVDGGKLDASNQIFLDQLTFGDKTDSPDAIQLPVLLAVSLLKNSRGEIDVNLPVSGSLDDPQFSVGGIVWRVVVNLLTKAVTAPFAWLAGDGPDELGYVPFDPGRADLDDTARQRLDTLAAKLADRPALKLEATGRADPVADTEGLRQAHVEQLMRAAKARSTGQPIGDVRIGADERPTWLAAAYKSADIKKPRNLIGLAKALPDAEMEALLKASAPIGPEALRLLANQRGDQVKAYLSRKMPPERVLLTASRIGADGLAQDEGPPTRVQFEIK